MFHPSTQVVFIFGHQRSGTNLLFRLLSDSLGARSYNEDNMDAFTCFRLRDTESIDALIATSARPCVFKPISQTMNFVEILASHRGARGVFIFRNPLDVVTSLLREYGSSLHELTHDIGYNFMVNRLRDLNITLSDWRPIDAIIDRFSGRFSLSSDFASKCALRWLLQHATLQQRGILQSSAVVPIAYEDILAHPEQVSMRLSAHLQADVGLPAMPHQRDGTDFFRDSIDVQLARDCMELFEAFREASRQ